MYSLYQRDICGSCALVRIKLLEWISLYRRKDQKFALVFRRQIVLLDSVRSLLTNFYTDLLSLSNGKYIPHDLLVGTDNFWRELFQQAVFVYLVCEGDARYEITEEK